MDKVKHNDFAREKQILIEKAESLGLEENFLFLSTLQRYTVQMDILDMLQEVIEKDGTLITKEYVKNRANVYPHPAIEEYNKTVDSANRTAATLYKILNGLEEEIESHNAELIELLNQIKA